MGNTLATAATVPFAGAICDLIGRRQVCLLGLVFIFVGMTVVGTAQRMEVAIGGTSLVGVGAGLAELVASAGVMELVPVRARGKYVGILYVMYLPVCGCQAYGDSLRLIIWLIFSSILFSKQLALVCMDCFNYKRSEFRSTFYLLSSPSSTKLRGSHQIRNYQTD